MATAPQYITVDEFERRYGHESGWEYWFGKAVQKPTPTWVHAILQQLIAELIRQAEYVTGPEVDLRTSPDWRTRPDVSCVRRREGRYPNTLDIAVEILSNDEGRYILEKCRVERTDLRLGNGISIAGDTIWQEFDRRLNPE